MAKNGMAEREVIPLARNIKDLDRQTGTKTPIEGKELSGASANRLTFPIIVAEWDRNAREVVRVSLDFYSGRNTIDVRTWYRDGDQLKPSKSGITLALHHLPNLAQGLTDALGQARLFALLDDGGAQ